MFRVANILALSFAALIGIAVAGSALPAAAGQFPGSGGRAFHGKVSVKHSHRSGRFSRKGYRHHVRRHVGPRRYATGGKWRHTRAFGHSAAASGVMLGDRARYGARRYGHVRGEGHHRVWSGRSGPKIIHVRDHLRDGKWRDRKSHGYNRVTVIVGGQAVEQDVAATGGSMARIEGGACASDTYCTVRLGPYANSPKIITLNTSGRTIAGETID